jgi:hypothetical protein
MGRMEPHHIGHGTRELSHIRALISLWRIVAPTVPERRWIPQSQMMQLYPAQVLVARHE